MRNMTNPSDTLALAERNVPRYTSYPTAPHFNGEIGPSTYAAWLEALAPDATVSLYVHVPFCTSLCLYCGCNTKAVRRHDPVVAYAERLFAEIRLIGHQIPGRRITHWHWGGGTPSILGADLLRAVNSAVRATFDVAPDAEHAIELDPRRLPDETIAALGTIGINRVSLGVQDFAPHVQKAIGRVQSFAVVKHAIARLRAGGIAAINLDLMYGLPSQSLGDVRDSARRAASLLPDRIALFGYAHVPWFKTHQRVIDAKTLPGAAERLAQAEAAAAVFRDAGYEAIGLDHFARPGDPLAKAWREGRLRRNFQGYTTDDADALIGLGASSISRLPQGYVQNAPDTGGYYRAIDAGEFATVKGRALTGDDRLRATIIEQLMCNGAVDLDRLACATTIDLRFASALSRLKELENAGILVRNRHCIAMTEHGRPFVRLVAAAFDAYLDPSPTGHSVAV